MVKKILIALLVVFVLIFVGIYLTGSYLNESTDDSANSSDLNKESDALKIDESDVNSQVNEINTGQIKECPKKYNEGYDNTISVKTYEKISPSSFALNISPQRDFEIYLEYGVTTEIESKTKKYFIEAGDNLEIVLSELVPATKYYFAVNYREDTSDSYMVEFIQGKKFFFVTADE